MTRCDFKISSSLHGFPAFLCLFNKLFCCLKLLLISQLQIIHFKFYKKKVSIFIILVLFLGWHIIKFKKKLFLFLSEATKEKKRKEKTRAFKKIKNYDNTFELSQNSHNRLVKCACKWIFPFVIRQLK